MNYLLILSLLFICSCTDYAEVKKTGAGSFIAPKSLRVKDYKIEKWRVGRPVRRQVVSKGIRIDVMFPRLSREDLDNILVEYSVNAWLLKVRRRSYAVNSVVGYIYIPLVVPGTQESNKYRRHQIKQGAFSIYYSAAALSKRFEGFECPAFDHNRYVDEVEIDERDTTLERLFVGKQTDDYVGAKVNQFSYSGNILNGGASILGDYTVQLALYNSDTKRRKSNFIELREVIRIVDEKTTNINGCEGFEIPIREEEGNKIEQFKWSR